MAERSEHPNSYDATIVKWGPIFQVPDEPEIAKTWDHALEDVTQLFRDAGTPIDELRSGLQSMLLNLPAA